MARYLNQYAEIRSSTWQLCAISDHRHVALTSSLQTRAKRGLVLNEDLTKFMPCDMQKKYGEASQEA
jgi:hypothetical protein